MGSPPATIPLFGPPGIKGKLPNILTAARIAFAGVFFALLSLYGPLSTGTTTAEAGSASSTTLLTAALILFVIAAFTDFLDGYLARRWGAVSVFGRVMDPFADKILILGAFILLAGPQFHTQSGQISGVQPWMAVLILARELLITSLRGVFEAQGINFSASFAGKAKMVVQSLSIPAILLWIILNPEASNHTVPAAIAGLATLVTLASATPYLSRAATALKSPSP